jgi:hypothetical protein
MRFSVFMGLAMIAHTLVDIDMKPLLSALAVFTFSTVLLCMDMLELYSKCGKRETLISDIDNNEDRD